MFKHRFCLEALMILHPGTLGDVFRLTLPSDLAQITRTPVTAPTVFIDGSPLPLRVLHLEHGSLNLFKLGAELAAGSTNAPALLLSVKQIRSIPHHITVAS